MRACACNAEEIKGLPVAPVLYPRLVIQRDCARGLENPMNSLFPCLRFSDVLSLSRSFTLSHSFCLSFPILSLSLTSSFLLSISLSLFLFSLGPSASLVTATRALHSLIRLFSGCERLSSFRRTLWPLSDDPWIKLQLPLLRARDLPRLRRCAIQNNEELMIFGSERARTSTRDAILRQPPVSRVGGGSLLVASEGRRLGGSGKLLLSLSASLAPLA